MLAQAHLRNYSAEGARSRVLAAENVGYKGKISTYQYSILISCCDFFFFFFNVKKIAIIRDIRNRKLVVYQETLRK